MNLSQFEREKAAYKISTDPCRIDLGAAHTYLSGSYWTEGLPKEILAKAIATSLCFALIEGSRQLGFARVVTDRATFAYLCDVYVQEEYRDRGLGKRLIDELVSHPDLETLTVCTSNFGFGPLQNPSGYMEIVRPDIYKREAC